MLAPKALAAWLALILIHWDVSLTARHRRGHSLPDSERMHYPPQATDAGRFQAMFPS